MRFWASSWGHQAKAKLELEAKLVYRPTPAPKWKEQTHPLAPREVISGLIYFCCHGDVGPGDSDPICLGLHLIPTIKHSIFT